MGFVTNSMICRWTFIGDSMMGDSHAESWDILSRRGLGLRDRMTRLRDTWLR